MPPRAVWDWQSRQVPVSARMLPPPQRSCFQQRGVVGNHGVELVTPEGGSRDRLLSVAQFIDAICFHYFSRRHRCLYSLEISAEGTM